MHAAFVILIALSVCSGGGATGSTVAPSQFPPVWVDAPTAPSSGSPANISFRSTVLPRAASGPLPVHIAVTTNPVGHWHVYCPMCSFADSCTGQRLAVSEQAKLRNCTLAFNGGPFSMTGPACMGPMVSEGVIVHNATSMPNTACIGLGTNPATGRSAWFFGAVPDFSAAAGVLPHVDSLLCGFDWVAYAGNNTVPGPGGLIAPRTLVGIRPDGTLVQAIVEGSEWLKWGMTLDELARWAIDGLGLAYAINLDGGGSSVAWYDPLGGVQGCPCAADVPICVERTVVTMMCTRES
jgi:hypothetical protein